MSSENKIKTSIVYHANCTDGMMAAFLFYLLYLGKDMLDQVEFIATNYGDKIPTMQGEEVIIADFSFTHEQMNTEKFRDKRVTILDHHEKPAMAFGGYKRYVGFCDSSCCNYTADFVQSMSGAGLAYEYITDKHGCFEGLSEDIWQRLFKVVSLVQDRDLWLFKHEETRAMYELLNSVPKTFEAWHELLIQTSDLDFVRQLEASQVRVEMRLDLAKSYASKATVLPYRDTTFALVNVASNFASEVGNILSEKHAFAAMFVVSPSNGIVIVSLRSKSGTGADVNKIANRFGGGGHVNAAGFSFSYVDKPELLTSLSDGTFFRDIDLNSNISTVKDLMEMREFYKGWYRITAERDVGSHSIVGDELNMLLRVYNFILANYKDKVKKPMSIMDIQELMLNDDFIRSEFGFLLS